MRSQELMGIERIRFILKVISFGAFAGVFAAGCSTAQPVKTGRSGFFQQLSSWDQGHPGRARQKVAKNTKINDDDDEAAEPNRSQESALETPERVSRVKKQVAMHWPLHQVRVTSPFGQRGSEFHEGIDLHAAKGTPVYSAHAGVVLYSGKKIRGYGNMVVIRHSSGIATIYAHNSRNLVRQGQHVHQGQKIAISGNTGHVRGPHLHFEVRDGVAAIDPMTVLPSVATANAQAGRAAQPIRKVKATRRHRRSHPAAREVALR